MGDIKVGVVKSTEMELRNVPLPEQTKSYTVISHGDIIDKIKECLEKNGFTITEQSFSSTAFGEIALGKFYLSCDKDPDMGMIFTWWNSYNKRVKFGCGVGGFIYENKASLIGSEGMSWIRKHTGTANVEAFSIIEQLIDGAGEYFDKIIIEKNRMIETPLSVEDYGCIMGAIFFEQDLIRPTQANFVKNERKKPSVDYTNIDSLWGLYKMLMLSIEEIDITKWASTQQKLHHAVMNQYAIKVTYKDLEGLTNHGVEDKSEEVVVPITEELGSDFDVDKATIEAPVELTKASFLTHMLNTTEIDEHIIDYWTEWYFDSALDLKSNEEAFHSYYDSPKAPAAEPKETNLLNLDSEIDTDASKEELNDVSEEELNNLFPEDLQVGESLDNNIDLTHELLEPKINIESDQEYLERVAKIEGEPEKDTMDLEIQERIVQLYGEKTSFTKKVFSNGKTFITLENNKGGFYI